MIEPTIQPIGVEMLKENCDVVLGQDGSEAGLIRQINEHQIEALVTRAEQVTRKVIESCPSLKVIAQYGVGLDNINVAAASENGARDVYAANCNHGPSVAPEYRFFLRDEATGAETPLTDWQAEGILACDKGALTGQCIRVYARAQGGADDPSLYFDFRPGIDEEPCLQV